jgi:hypothetical protein
LNILLGCAIKIKNAVIVETLKGGFMRSTLKMVLILVICSLIMFCSKDELNKTYSNPQLGISFSYPAEWTIEEIEDSSGVLLLCPTIEKDWQANVFFDLSIETTNRKLPQMVDELIPKLNKGKPNFSLLGTARGNLHKGLEYGKISYTCKQDHTDLSEEEVLIPLGEDKLLFVLTSAEISLKQKYQPIFESIINSIEVRVD